ncbi:MAG: O-antigen ligase family protein [Planctomycetota bacterium]
MNLAIPTSTKPRVTQPACAHEGLSWLEKIILAVGVFEIPLQVDKYFMFHEADAAQGAVAGFNVSVTTLAIAALYGLWFLRSTDQRRRTHTRLIVGVPMLLYLGSVALSSLTATLPMLAYFDLFLLLQAYLLFYYVANRVHTREDIMLCIGTLAAALLFQSLLIFGLKLLRVDNTFIEIGPLVLTVWEGERHGGSMQSPVLAGSTMALLWLPVATAVLGRWSQLEFGRLFWLLFLSTTVIGMIGILLTQTRGAILTSVVGSSLIGLGLLSRTWLPRWTVGVAIVMGLLSLYPLWVIYEKRIKEGDGDSASARKHLSLIALEAIQDRPIFGHGAGNCHLAAKRYADQGKWRSEWYYTIHSKYLLVWLETGLIGLLTFLLVLANGLRLGFQAWLTKDKLLSPLGLALAAALAGHSLHMAVDVFNSRTQVQTLWLLLGLAAATYRVAVLASSPDRVVPVGWRMARQPHSAKQALPLHSGQGELA